jgi:hypothetical protein
VFRVPERRIRRLVQAISPTGREDDNMQTTVQRRSTWRRALTAGISVAAVSGATVFGVQFASAGEAPATAQTCGREALPIPEGLVSTRVSGMSDDGSVIAYYALPLDQSWPDGLGAFPRLYAGGEVTEVDMPGDHPRLYDVNASGEAAGYSVVDGRETPYVWSGGVLTELTVIEDSGRAMGINERGDVVGSSWSFEGGIPVMWPADGSGPVELAIPEGSRSGVAHDIGDDGTAVGAVYNENGTATAYLWHPDGTGEALPAPEGAEPGEGFSIAVDVNGDWVSGTFFVPGSGAAATGTRWNLAEGTAEVTELDDQVAVSAEGTVAGYTLGTVTKAAYQEGETVVELPGVAVPEFGGDTAAEISADGTRIAGDVYIETDDAGLPVTNAVVWTCG